jgi:hypothetical protein
LKGGDTVKDAQRVLSENLFAVDNGTFKDIKKIRFREFGKVWLDSYLQSNIKETAHYQYTFVVYVLTTFTVSTNFKQRQLFQPFNKKEIVYF